MKAISMPEASEYLEGNPEAQSFIKSFVTTDTEKAKEIRSKLMELGLIKLNEKHISKIIDVMPKDKNDLNDILNDVTLDENETNNVLDAIKQ